MDRNKLSLNITDKHIALKFSNVSGATLTLDKMRIVYNNIVNRNKTVPLDINQHHLSVKFANSGTLKYVSFNIDTLGAR
jgi:hypothetical protein